MAAPNLAPSAPESIDPFPDNLSFFDFNAEDDGPAGEASPDASEDEFDDPADGVPRATSLSLLDSEADGFSNDDAVDIAAEESLRSLPKETTIRPTEDESSGESEIEEDDEDIGDEESEGGDNNSASPTTPSPPTRPSPDDEELQYELEIKYILTYISSISYALAVDVHYLDGSYAPDVAREYYGARDYSFYPLAFYPAYGNFSSTRLPAFLVNNVLTFFFYEPDEYTHLLYSFRPAVFPGVLATYAYIFDTALGELHRRIDGRKADGVDITLAEGVAAIDRLESYCFTGFPRSLIASVMKPL
ncbi:hypothetical protein AYO21_12132 [Fonsecaea monophora]|uniref:Uncharacterized protein n=1 Tax=Fonsecaea monophora TaxID=254056 RepID=A0A177ER50_9EURO|nr:hypothetical protein AYO21_12132 [Fonsecaea monophora]OAG33780.1 hypothetical protein AYO21_12132 [Fonsecaea monophora]